MLARLVLPWLPRQPAAAGRSLAGCHWFCSTGAGSHGEDPTTPPAAPTLPEIGGYGEDPAAVGVAAAEEEEAAEHQQPDDGNVSADAAAAASEDNVVGPKPVAGQEDQAAAEYPDAPDTSGHAHAGWPQWK